jgi:hypothetical protein
MNGATTRAFGIFLFVVIGASALILGVLSANKDINAPMQVNEAATAKANALTNGVEALKTKDTDGDGLSDYDELYVYHTSPYIKDSDSDGIPDGVEIKNGTDPNCPEGKNCGTPAPANYPPPTAMPDLNTAANALSNLDSLLANLPTGDSTPTPPTAPTAKPTPSVNLPAPSGSGTTSTGAAAAQIRALLKQQGLGDNILSTIDDQTLIDMYNQSAAAVTNNSNTNQ